MSETTLNPNAAGPNEIGGVFSNIESGTVANLDIEVDGNITFNQELVTTYFGIVIGKMNNTILYNTNVYIDGNQVQFIFNDATHRAETYVGGIVARVDKNSQIKKCSLNLTNNAKIFVTDTNDDNTYNFYMGGIAAITVGEENERISISNCNVNLENSGMEMIIPNSGLCGGVFS